MAGAGASQQRGQRRAVRAKTPASTRTQARVAQRRRGAGVRLARHRPTPSGRTPSRLTPQASVPVLLRRMASAGRLQRAVVLHDRRRPRRSRASRPPHVAAIDGCRPYRNSFCSSGSSKPSHSIAARLTDSSGRLGERRRPVQRPSRETTSAVADRGSRCARRAPRPSAAGRRAAPASATASADRAMPTPRDVDRRVQRRGDEDPADVDDDPIVRQSCASRTPPLSRDVVSGGVEHVDLARFAEDRQSDGSAAADSRQKTASG